MFNSARYTGGSGVGLNIGKMEHYNDGEVNFGPLIDLNTEDFGRL